MFCEKAIAHFAAFYGPFFFSRLDCYVFAAVRKIAAPIVLTLNEGRRSECAILKEKQESSLFLFVSQIVKFCLNSSNSEIPKMFVLVYVIFSSGCVYNQDNVTSFLSTWLKR